MNIIDIAHERRRRKIHELVGMSGVDINIKDALIKAVEDATVKIHDGNKEYIYTEEELSLDRINIE